MAGTLYGRAQGGATMECDASEWNERREPARWPRRPPATPMYYLDTPRRLRECKALAGRRRRSSRQWLYLSGTGTRWRGRSPGGALNHGAARFRRRGWRLSPMNSPPARTWSSILILVHWSVLLKASPSSNMATPLFQRKSPIGKRSLRWHSLCSTARAISACSRILLSPGCIWWASPNTPRCCSLSASCSKAGGPISIRNSTPRTTTTRPCGPTHCCEWRIRAWSCVISATCRWPVRQELETTRGATWRSPPACWKATPRKSRLRRWSVPPSRIAIRSG